MRYLTRITGFITAVVMTAAFGVLGFAHDIALRLYGVTDGFRPSLPLVTDLAVRMTQPFFLIFFVTAFLSLILVSEIMVKEQVSRLFLQLFCLICTVILLFVVLFGFFLAFYIPDTVIA